VVFETVQSNEALFRELADCTDPAHQAWILNELVRRNKGLVIQLAKRFRRRGVSYDDLKAEALYGLTAAIRHYDHKRGWRFSTYAWVTMRQKLRRLVFVESRHRKRLGWSLEGSQNYLIEDIPRNQHPAQSEIVHRPWSELVCERLQVTQALTDRERAILALRFPASGAVLPLGECGRLLNLSKERIRQIQNTAIRKLKEELDGENRDIGEMRGGDQGGQRRRRSGDGLA